MRASTSRPPVSFPLKARKEAGLLGRLWFHSSAEMLEALSGEFPTLHR